MSAWKRLDAIPSVLNTVQSGVCDPMQSSLYVCMEKDAIPSHLDIVQSGMPLACPLRCVPPDRMQSSLHVCIEKAQCNPKSFGHCAEWDAPGLPLALCAPRSNAVITSCLH